MAFQSRALNLVPGTSGTNWFVRDLELGRTLLLDAKGFFLNPDDREAITFNNVTLATGFSELSSQSRDGRYKLNVVTTNRLSQIYLEDIQQGNKELVSIASDSLSAGNSSSFEPLFARDDHAVIFASAANNLVNNTGFSTLPGQLYLRDLDAKATVQITRNFRGTGRRECRLTPGSFAAAASTNGQRIVYQAAAIDLVPNNTMQQQAIYLYDVQSRSNTLVSVNVDGRLPNDISSLPLIIPEGRFVVFTSLGTDLVAGSTTQIGPQICSSAISIAKRLSR